MTNVGVIGLGNMGAGMALSAARAGMSVTGYDPQSAFKVELADAKVELVNSIAELCRHADVLVMSLPTSEVVEQVVLGEGGILHHARSGQFVLDTSTADPASTARIARALQGSPLRFVDGPVSGGPRAARTGSMTMLLG